MTAADVLIREVRARDGDRVGTVYFEWQLSRPGQLAIVRTGNFDDAVAVAVRLLAEQGGQIFVQRRHVAPSWYRSVSGDTL